MQINDTIIHADLSDVLSELQRQLYSKHIPYLQKTQDSGKNIMVQCPFHGNGQERRPSAGIRKADGMFHCFACHEVHTLPEVISFCFGAENDIFGQFGMKWLVRNFGTVEVEERKDVEIDLERNNISHKSGVLDSSDSDKPQWVSEEELDSYRYYHRYWEERGIYDDEIIELFDLGYDKKTDCITFPVRDRSGNCLFVARRSVKSKMFNYPKDVEKPLYGLYELFNLRFRDFIPEVTVGYDYYKQTYPGSLDFVIVTESMIDCILLYQEGLYAVALNGTGSELQYKQLNMLPTRHIIVATDNDKAGQSARQKICEKVKHKLITHIEFPKDVKDIGDLGKAKRFREIRRIRDWEVF